MLQQTRSSSGQEGSACSSDPALLRMSSYVHQAMLLLHAGPVQAFIMSGHHGPRYLERPSAGGIVVCEDSVAFGRARDFFLRSTTQKL